MKVKGLRLDSYLAKHLVKPTETSKPMAITMDLPKAKYSQTERVKEIHSDSR